MKIKPIIIVSGEPYGVFLEIFFKTLKINLELTHINCDPKLKISANWNIH